MEYQGIDKVQQTILRRFDWPGRRKACGGGSMHNFHACSFEEKALAEIGRTLGIKRTCADRPQKICITDTGGNQILVIMDHFTKLTKAVPCQTASAEETCDHSITHWISS